MNGDDTTKAGTETQDWSRFDAMTDEERHAAALSDPDARPLTEEDMDRMVQVPRVTIIRRAFRLSIEEFAEQFQIPVEVVTDWESRRAKPDAAARAYLKVIAGAPDAVRAALTKLSMKAAE